MCRGGQGGVDFQNHYIGDTYSRSYLFQIFGLFRLSIQLLVRGEGGNRFSKSVDLKFLVYFDFLFNRRCRERGKRGS